MDQNNNEKVLFCRKCGNKLLDDTIFCEKCGTSVVVLNDIDSNIEDLAVDPQQETLPKNKKCRKKIMVFSAIGIMLAVIIVIMGFWFFETSVVKQDINTINGCPEFYNIEFGMTVDEASENIQLKHKKFEGLTETSLFEIDDFMETSRITFEEGEIFYLFGKKTSDVAICFNKKNVDGVLLCFSLDDYELSDIISIYKEIYGEPTIVREASSSWIGPKTTIDAFIFTSDDGEREIVVRYVITTNTRYSTLSFEGPELDPCDFLGKNSPFDKTPEYYIDGLKEDDDYFKLIYEAEEFTGITEYVLLPDFEYMGVTKGSTAISLNQNANENYIGFVSYKFWLDEINVVDKMEYIHSKLLAKYGTPTSSIYRSIYDDKTSDQSLSFDEMAAKFSNATEGMYFVQWENEGIIITLDLSITKDEELYEGAVSYAN